MTDLVTVALAVGLGLVVLGIGYEWGYRRGRHAGWREAQTYRD